MTTKKPLIEKRKKLFKEDGTTAFCYPEKDIAEAVESLTSKMRCYCSMATNEEAWEFFQDFMKEDFGSFQSQDGFISQEEQHNGKELSHPDTQSPPNKEEYLELQKERVSGAVPYGIGNSADTSNLCENCGHPKYEHKRFCKVTHINGTYKPCPCKKFQPKKEVKEE